MNKRLIHIWAIVIFLPLIGCFTGVENTGHVTERDVQRAITQAARYENSTTLPEYKDSVPVWKPGKQFYVCDNQARLLFAHSTSYDIDTVGLAGKLIRFVDYETGGVLDNRATVNLRFTDGNNVFVYRTDKTIDEFTSSFAIPMLIDMDEVRQASGVIQDREYYVKTPICYDPVTDQMTRGRQFVKVHIDSVLPGNKVFPLKVVYTSLDKQEKAYVWVALRRNMMRSREFDALFTLSDVRQQYSHISNENWQRIVNCQVAAGMTKEECRLAKGNPKRVTEIPDQRGMREYWFYDGGSYLYFVDGVLTENR